MKSRQWLERGAGALIVAAACMVAGTAWADDADALNGDARKGAEKVSMCIGCHGIPGYKASFPQVYHVPMIAGQNAAYIVAALKQYADGSRSFPTMDAIATSLSDQDMADVAAYYSSLK